MREIVSLGRHDYRFHKVAQWSGRVVLKGGWKAEELKVAVENWHLTFYNPGKQFGPRSGLTESRSWSGSKLFDTRKVVLNDFCRKINFEISYPAILFCKHCRSRPAGFCKHLGMFVCFVALRPKSTAMVIAGRSVHLTTLFPGQA